VNLPIRPASQPLNPSPQSIDPRQPEHHPLPHGQIINSPGCHFTYRIIGPCCRLFDRDTLPWPCCRLEWHSKEPSWRRVGKQLVIDMASRNSPSYSVEIIGQDAKPESMVITLYPIKFTATQREWWHSRKPTTMALPPIE
jgi:hypothetical protein